MSLYLKKRKRFLKKIFVGASLFLLGVLFFSLLSFIPSFFGRPIPWTNPTASILLMSLLAIAVYKPLDKIFTKFFKDYLFKKKSYGHMVLMGLAEELQTVLELQELSNLIVNTFGEILHLKTVALVVPRARSRHFEILSAYGWNVSDVKKGALPSEAPMIELIRSRGPHVLVRDQVVRSFSWQIASQLSHDFTTLRASWVIPLFVKEELVGMIGLASASPESIFDEADFQFFRAFAHSAAKSLRNALQYHRLEEAQMALEDSQSETLQHSKRSAIEQLASGLAHEIHNPLTIISGKAQLLLLKKGESPLPEKIEEVLRVIVRETERAAGITRKLLMFSQGSGALREALDLEQVFKDTVALVSYQTSMDNIRMTYWAHGSAPLFYGNVHEIREVFLSLVLNAVQSIGKAGGEIHGRIHFHLRDQIVEISIQDTGPGIPREHLDKVFHPFFTTRQNAVGLGLFIARQIVHRYGGSIRVESRLGEGSLFSVRLPCAASLKMLEGGEEGTVPVPSGMVQEKETKGKKVSPHPTPLPTGEREASGPTRP